MKRGKNMLAYAARVALFFKQKKGQLQNRKQRKILKREQYTKETAVIDTTQAVQALELKFSALQQNIVLRFVWSWAEKHRSSL